MNHQKLIARYQPAATSPFLGFAFPGFAFALLVILMPALQASAQSVAEPVVDAAALERVSRDIEYLASDELAGREPGTPGMKLAEDYIARAFTDAKLKSPFDDGTFLQTFTMPGLVAMERNSASLTFRGPDGNEISPADDDWVPFDYSDTIDLKAPLFFVGYGINAQDDHNYNDYRDVDVDGKIVVMIRREPQQLDSDSVFDGDQLSRYSYIVSKVAAAKAAGAAGIIMVNDGHSVDESQADELPSPKQFGESTLEIPFAQIRRETLDSLLAASPLVSPLGEELSSLGAIEALIDAELEPLSQPMKGWVAQQNAVFNSAYAETANIVGVAEGSGPLAGETIVIGAHYDHIGRGDYGSNAPAEQIGQIHNGADDNASGTAAVMELARRFGARENRVGRRLVFVCFSGEERGLLGSRHYVEDAPLPLASTVLMINYDMIGWLREDRLTLFGWNSAPELEAAFDSANADAGLELVKPGNEFAGSDHLLFDQRGIPNTFIHTGLNSVYHTPDDDFEAINCVGVTRVIDFSESVIDTLAQLAERPTYYKPKPFRLGVLCEQVGETLVIERVASESIAALAGLRAGDVLVSWNDETLSNQRRLRRAIRRDRGKTVTVKIIRAGETREVMVELKE